MKSCSEGAMIGRMVVQILFGLLAFADSSYVGSRACGGCHAAIYSSYAETAMGRSLRRVDEADQLPLVPDPVVVNGFKVYRRGGNIYQSEIEKDAYGSPIGQSAYKLEYVIGSGANGYGYIVSSGMRLVEAPLSYYTKSKRWALSPGYQEGDRGFQRPIVAGCLDCHSGGPRPVAHRLGLYEDPPFREVAIGCENCHGPGSEHALALGVGSIVNPAKLPSAQQSRLCARCHQDAGANPNSDLLAQDSAMRQSKCYIATGGRLMCITCHDPHGSVRPAEAVAYYRGKCLTCHASVADHGENCTGCHLPKHSPGTVPHAALTNHRIQIRP
jgi:predicted CXXCH cytochrome family protein